jgi:hypothetical protein
MLRKIIASILIIFSSFLLGLSIAGIALVWMFKEPLTKTSTARLTGLDTDLGLAQTTLQNAEQELERTLRIVETAEISLAALKVEFTQAKTLFGEINGTMGSQLIPSLKAARTNLDQAKGSIQELLDSIKQINSLPFGNFNIPGDKLLADLIVSADSLDYQIVRAEELVKKASTFAGDASYFMGFDFSETKRNLQDFLKVVKEYDQKLAGWRTQLSGLIKSLPGWINAASIGLTVFLLWFGFSQFGMIIHGLAIRHGGQALLIPKMKW